MVKSEQFNLVENIQDCQLNHELVPKMLSKYEHKLRVEDLFHLYKQDNVKKLSKMRQFLLRNKIKVRKRYSFFGKALEHGVHYKSFQRKKKVGPISDKLHNSMDNRSTSAEQSRKTGRNDSKIGPSNRLNYSHSNGNGADESSDSLQPIMIRRKQRTKSKMLTLFQLKKNTLSNILNPQKTNFSRKSFKKKTFIHMGRRMDSENPSKDGSGIFSPLPGVS
jgi:hypothetical protein